MRSLDSIQKSDITDALKDIRKLHEQSNRYDAASMLVALLEGADCFDKADIKPEQRRFFCHAYLWRFLKRFLVDPQKIEIVMATFGMLQGFSELTNLTDRRNLYIEQACQTNEHVKPTWLSDNKRRQADNLRAEEDAYFDLIAENVIRTGRAGALGLFAEVLQELREKYPSDLPQEVPLTVPQYIQGASRQEEETSAAPSVSGERRLSKVQRLSILALAGSFLFLVAGVGLFWSAFQDDNTIQSISVMDSDITLYPGGFERLRISTAPADADQDTLECHSDSNPWITVAKTADWEDTNTWTESWSTIAASDWTETLPFSGKVSVMGGDANPVYVDVTVESPAYKQSSDTTDGSILGGSNDVADAGAPDTP